MSSLIGAWAVRAAEAGAGVNVDTPLTPPYTSAPL